jgi:hypothetical protein
MREADALFCSGGISSELGNNLGTIVPKHKGKLEGRVDQKAGRINKIAVPALSAKPPSPVQIRAAPPKLLGLKTNAWPDPVFWLYPGRRFAPPFAKAKALEVQRISATWADFHPCGARPWAERQYANGPGRTPQIRTLRVLLREHRTRPDSAMESNRVVGKLMAESWLMREPFARALKKSPLLLCQADGRAARPNPTNRPPRPSAASGWGGLAILDPPLWTSYHKTGC